MIKIFLTILLSVILQVSVLARSAEDDLKVYFLDVGQGDSTLIVTNDGRKILIDGGPSEKVIEELGKVLPFWVNDIDLMIASHGDADHITGLVDVVERYKVKRFAYSGVSKDTLVFNRLFELLQASGTEIIQVRDNDDLKIGCCFNIDILWPKSGDISNLEQNDTSVSFIASYNKFDMYMAGDLSAKYEEEMLKDELTDVELMKISHHGSRSSTSEKLLTMVTPEIAVIPVGKDNRYGHPHKEVVKLIEEKRIKFYRTDLSGIVTVSSDGKIFSESTERMNY